MADNRYSRPERTDSSATPFPGRSARGRTTGRTTLFGNGSASTAASTSHTQTRNTSVESAAPKKRSVSSASPHASASAERAERYASSQNASRTKATDNSVHDKPKTVAVPKKKKPKKSSAGKKLIALLLVLFLTVTGSGFAACSYILGDYKNEKLGTNVHVSEDKLKSDKDVTNILLMGIDTEQTSASTRSDAMVLVSIDSKNRKIKLTSFLRDMYVTVPGHGETKLTHACAYKDGGPQLTCDTIELNFGIRIDGYAKIGYDIFKEVIDAVGGITVKEIDKTESRALARENVRIEPGTNIHLDGNQALQYCRIRKGQSDFDRTERQRETISLVLAKIKKTNPLKLIKLVKSVTSKITCSIPKGELIKIGLSTLPCLLNKAEQTKVPADGAWSYGSRGGMSVVLVDLDKNKKFLSEWLYGE